MNPCYMAPYAVEVAFEDGRVVQGYCVIKPSVPYVMVTLAYGRVVYIPLVNLSGKEKPIQPSPNAPKGVKAVPTFCLNEQLFPKGTEHYIIRVINYIEGLEPNIKLISYLEARTNQLNKVRVDFMQFIKVRKRVYDSSSDQAYFNRIEGIIRDSWAESMSLTRVQELLNVFAEIFKYCLKRFPLSS